MLKALPPLSYYLSGIAAGDRIVLSKAITLIESTKAEHRALANELIGKVLPQTGNSIRLGITGVPGAGKSSFIERFGLHLIKEGKKVAVLAVDPTSSKTKGSILGDKTRMEELSNQPKAYIRPSAAGDSLGGVANKTRETMLLCEAAGFNVILIETVGVGQSEVAVNGMVDFFLLLALTGAGDELQGMKRGIMEMADLIVVNKADGTNADSAKRTAVEYNRALSLFPKRSDKWKPTSIPVSALTGLGIDKVWEHISNYIKSHEPEIKNKRSEQSIDWMHETIRDLLLSRLYANSQNRSELSKLEDLIKENKISSYQAAMQAIQLIG